VWYRDWLVRLQELDWNMLAGIATWLMVIVLPSFEVTTSTW
jgi:hypothetical protein